MLATGDLCCSDSRKVAMQELGCKQLKKTFQVHKVRKGMPGKGNRICKVTEKSSAKFPMFRSLL